MESLPTDVIYLLVTEYLHPVVYNNLKKTCHFFYRFMNREDVKAKMWKNFGLRTSGELKIDIFRSGKKGDNGERVEKLYSNGSYISLLDGKKHSFDGNPAYIHVGESSNRLVWYNNGRRHSFNGEPSRIEYHPSYVSFSYFHEKGDLPNSLTYWKNGDRRYVWLKEGKRYKDYSYYAKIDHYAIHTFKDEKLHSYDGEPARIRSSPEGYIVQWNLNGKLQSFDGNPSRITVILGSEIKQEWHDNGKLQSINGKPSLIRKYGDITEVMWHLNGRLESFVDNPSISRISNNHLAIHHHMNGLRHSFGDEPSKTVVTELDDGRKYFSLSWYEFGIKIDSLKFFTDRDGEIIY